eukprot:jgi/Psemu1/55759/gm1.55759_g
MVPEKNFLSTINKCQNTTPYAFYEWYMTFFHAHCVCCGKYCHPYPCFDGTCTHSCGFSLGITNQQDNLPPSFTTKIDNDSHIIWDILHVAFSMIPNYLHVVN